MIDIPVGGLVTVFIVVTMITFALTYVVFPPKGSKLGRAIQLLFFLILGSVGIYWYFEARDEIIDLIGQGSQAGQLAGESESMEWCLQNSGHQFLDENEDEAKIKIIGFTAGCLATAGNTEQLCAGLPEGYEELTDKDMFRQLCGPHGICEMVFEGTNAYCRP